MNLHIALLLSVFIFTSLITSCTKESIEPVDSPAVSTTTDSEQSKPIKFGLQNNMLSGLPVLHPAVMIITDGAVLAFRAGIPEAGEAITAIASGELVEDMEDRKQEIQAALAKLLDSENIALESIVGADEKVILFFSPDKSLGECPPCNDLFATLKVGELIGEFTIKKVAIENR